MTVGSPTRDILKFAVPLICGYVLQQMYLIIDAAMVGRFVSVNALAAVGASTSIMFLIMGFCNVACAGFAIPAVCGQCVEAFGSYCAADNRCHLSAVHADSTYGEYAG